MATKWQGLWTIPHTWSIPHSRVVGHGTQPWVKSKYEVTDLFAPGFKNEITWDFLPTCSNLPRADEPSA